MDFVWIYAKPFSYYGKSGLWNELEYSIKSVKKNFKGAKIWVVGDDPAPLKANHIYVDRIMTHSTNLPIDMDVIKKFRKIIDSEIDEEFILMYDDVFLLQPMTRDDFTFWWARCEVDDIEGYRRAWSRDYKFLWRNTYRLIKPIADKVYDWETHIPRMFEKKKLEKILDDYHCDEVPLIATSLYAAHYIEQTVVMDETVQYNLMNDRVTNFDEGFKCKFLNIMDDSITLAFQDKMTEVFGEGTSFKPTHRRH